MLLFLFASFWSIFLLSVTAHRPRDVTTATASRHGHPSLSEALHKGNQTIHRRPTAVQPVMSVHDGLKISVNTTGCIEDSGAQLHKRASTPITTRSTFLVIARDNTSAYSAYSGLNDYGIPYELLIVPQSGAALPALNTTNNTGNYGGIVVLSEVSYQNSAGVFVSALTTAQWNALYAYQVAFGARMVRLDALPSSASGTKVTGACCADGVEQFVSISDTSKFKTAGLVQGATMSTMGLYHYTAAITNSSTTVPFATYGTSAGISSTSVAGVINTFSGRQQMVFFIPFSTDWSLTSVVLQHAWIHWATRGLYPGYRRMMLSTQVDDMFLTTAISDGTLFRLAPSDLTAHIPWMASINSRLPAGSNYTMEIGHNGNGNIDASSDISSTVCPIDPIIYNQASAPTLAPEAKKVPGTGTNLWPATASTYPYPLPCVSLDPLAQFFQNASQRDKFMHLSHTFTHESEDAATGSDVSKEISWNQAWLRMIGLSGAKWFSAKGLIPPAITGLHNGDALSAWANNSVFNAVGDNTRSVLLNQENEHWPLMSTVEDNGFAGIQITPRWATNIYYDSDSADNLVPEYIKLNAADPSSTLDDILELEKSTNTRHLLTLHHDPFMFHQANLQYSNLDPIPVNGKSQQLSLLMAWVESVISEVTRLVTWPVVTLKHDDLAAKFRERMVRDGCAYTMSWTSSSGVITSVTITPTTSCAVAVPITVPGSVRASDIKGLLTEQMSGDPLTIWVPLSGQEITITLTEGVAW